ncbi:MAG: hypothetical protein U1E73_03265 [Planctomycetota bacterium]
MRTLFPFVLAVGIGAALTAQDLRRGIADADLVAVGRQVGKRPVGEALVLHRVQVVKKLIGTTEATAVVVLDWPKLAMHNRPSPRQSRLYCLRDASATAARLGLSATEGPYYQMVGWAGSSPLIGADLDRDPIVAFAGIFARSAAGASAEATAGELAEVAAQGHASVRVEAARYLTERGDLRASLAPVQWSRLVARATGETADVPYKIALAELCGEQAIFGIVDALAASLGPVEDPEFARTVGRIATALHGEAATSVLEKRLVHLDRPADRAAVLRAIGATNTRSALALLLRLNGRGADEAVEAALGEHRSPEARDAIAHKR